MSNADPPTPTAPSWRPFLLFVAALFLVLALLHREAFLPDRVQFSNDVSYGMMKTPSVQGLKRLFGPWTDSSWLGEGASPASPSFSALFPVVLGVEVRAKFYVLTASLLSGMCGWATFRLLGAGPWVCAFVGFATALHSYPLSVGAWGLASRTLAFGLTMLSAGVFRSGLRSRRILSAIVTGGLVGFAVIEGQDVGALFAMLVGWYGVFISLVQPGTWRDNIRWGIIRMALVVGMAAFVAFHSVVFLATTQIGGMTGMGADAKARADRWNWATQWSLPVEESLRQLVPGYFGYRMDTPDGGFYWGRIGQTPGFETSRQGLRNFSGSGEYPGLLTVLAALWAVAAALFVATTRTGDKETPLYSPLDRWEIGFWAGACLICLLLAWGRWAPFYQLIYPLPFFSQVRNPVKFMMLFGIANVMLAGFGAWSWSRWFIRPLDAPAAAARAGARPTPARPPRFAWKTIATWLKTSATSFEQRWMRAAPILAFFAIALSALTLAFGSSIHGFIATQQGFQKALADKAWNHLVGELAVFTLFWLVSVALITTIVAGLWRGRVTAAWLILLAVLALDLGRANLPWIRFEDASRLYQPNPILDVLASTPHQGRVTFVPPTLVQSEPRFSEWHQKLFLYFGIQSIDPIQLPRVPPDFEGFTGALSQKPLAYWMLSNVRYFISEPQYVDILNQQLDPTNKSFRLVRRFGFKPNSMELVLDQGPFALIEFTGTLPRANLYSRWQALPDPETLQSMRSPEFNPRQFVVLSTNLPPSVPLAASAELASKDGIGWIKYDSLESQFRVTNSVPAVLHISSRFHPSWHFSVDGQPAPLLRLNFAQLGTFIPPGEHTVAMRFQQPLTGPLISLAGVVTWLVALALWLFGRSRAGIGAPPA